MICWVKREHKPREHHPSWALAEAILVITTIHHHHATVMLHVHYFVIWFLYYIVITVTETCTTYDDFLLHIVVLSHWQKMKDQSGMLWKG